MTDTQRGQLERATQRAQKAGLMVVGIGKSKTDGRTVYAVPSSVPNKLHLVWEQDGSLRCTCVGCAHGYICLHRAVVHQFLLEGLQAAEKAMAVKRQKSTLARDNKPVSIFK
jgi:hypothetical protein